MKSLFKNILQSFLLVMLIVTNQNIFAQDVEKLEEKKEKLESEMAYNTKILSEIREEKQESLGELKVLEKQLEKRQNLLETLNLEVENIGNDIAKFETEIDSIKLTQANLRDQYAQMIRHAYKSKSSYSALLFLLSAETFNDAYKRMKYIRYYNDDKRKKVEALAAITDTLSVRIQELEKGKAEQEILIGKEIIEKNELKKEQVKLDDVVGKLKKREKELKEDNENKQATIRQLESEIRGIINKVIATDESLPEPPPAKVKLSSDFKNNQGKLPWPVQQGIITGEFGEQPHPVLRGIKTQNDGIEITTTKGTNVYAVADGKVSQVIFSAGFKSAIIVQHGSYFTVYSNMEKEVEVAKGQQVTQGQKLGRIFTDSRGKTELNFQIWKNTNKLDPKRWINKK